MITVREATNDDILAIKNVVKAAFYREGSHERFNEWEMVERVTKDNGFVKELCLVAELNDEFIGYNLLSKAQIGSNQGLALGPLAVSPTHQNKGIGKMLVVKGFEVAKAMGYQWVALTGGDYYLQFGFEAALPHNIILSEGNPELLEHHRC
ncbi:N-acetyltransferase [Anaerobacillus alkaliphilus]|uniref:N-acetyltransferase n=1 Tax=Anaerobacillus alkaliphilus TaxID=1548597 RepID=A0A4Q0VNQ2_9BACI|nr:N-acetyltransferase [Anaerobacillus alkaliphilus]RXI96646.1 N-acetyltransferase [Anaerobacillus alkaliphilus]